MTWPGRFQAIQDGGISWYLDGAHTKESMILAVKWFYAQVHSSVINLLKGEQRAAYAAKGGRKYGLLVNTLISKAVQNTALLYLHEESLLII